MEDQRLPAAITNEALTPAELIKKHISNPKHTITEDELRNLRVGDETENSKELTRKIEEKEAEDNCHHHENNTYDILDA